MSTTIIGIQTLTQLTGVLSTDLFHLARTNDFSTLLSYKSQTREMDDVFIKASVITDLQKTLNTSINELKTVSASMLLRSAADSTYIKTDSVNARTQGLITNSEVESEISKFPSEITLSAKYKELYAEACRLADEMTDFTGAAMVGINQSNSSFQSMPEEDEKKDEKKS